ASLNAKKNNEFPVLKLFVKSIKYKNSDDYFDLTLELTDGKDIIQAYWISKSFWYRDFILEQLKEKEFFYFRGKTVKKLPFFVKNINWIVEETLPLDKIYKKKTASSTIAPEMQCDSFILFPEFCSSLKDALKPKPIYHAKSSISTRVVSKTFDKIFANLKQANISNLVPLEIRANNNLYSRIDSYYAVHKPNCLLEYNKGIRSLIFEEAWSLHIPLLAKKKLELENGKNKKLLTFSNEKKNLLNAFDNSYDFSLTPSQKRVSALLDSQLSNENCQKRLLQGDTASGKTLVALRQMISFALDNFQSALLAPTLVIAWQHYYTIKTKLDEMHAKNPNFPKIDVELITGDIQGKSRKKILEKVNDNSAKIIIGTTALLNIENEFKNLKLLIIDEQHKYGVVQRNAITKNSPHVISMSATPIPRSVALSIFADYSIDTLEKPESNCSNIQTHLISAKNKTNINSMKAKILKEIKSGRQAIIVVPRIKVCENLESIYSIYNEYLSDKRFAECKIKYIHGKQTPDEKVQIMEEMRNGKIDLLISTNVIEVWVDIKNASTIAIYNASNFSISELHQLRGRAGRDKAFAKNAYCFLAHSSKPNTIQRVKLNAIKENTDGFSLSTIDLKLRGEGNILGNEQSGKKSNLKIMRILENLDILELSFSLANKHIASSQWSENDIKELESQGQKIYLETNEFLNKI
ncbi:MAG: DEAD/DEAH box helicase, partial [Bifidobacteriaceae bacterium]|nr:DEAD/DEAH box helicase [Bifidobacteriaceae bacterium]